jgi:class 3 adenylate cyclase/CheY-like chemotaxis protein
VRAPPRILVVDDMAANVHILQLRLSAQGYEVLTATDGEAALTAARELLPDLILLDVMMPKVDGLEVCRQLRADPSFPFTPIIMITAKADPKDVVAGLEAGGDEYLTKPVDQIALVARVKSMLRIKELHDSAEAMAVKLAEWNRTLEQRVEAQVTQLDRLSRLKRFFSPQLAELIVDGGAEDPLQTHRREVTVVFLDLRGFTSFAETAEPEEVMGVLREYHSAMGVLILEHQGTLERFAGDGMMVFFNDPVPVPDGPERAVRMSLAMRDRAAELGARWRKRGHELDVGIGIAQGFATIGAIGFEGRLDYGAIGTVTNLAARLCGAATAGQILVSQRLLGAVEAVADAEPIGELPFKGFSKPVPAFNVVGLKTPETGRPSGR